MSYQPPSQRSRSRHRSGGAVVFCCILLVIAGFVGFVVWASKQPEPEEPKITITKPPSAKPAIDPTIKIENAKREDDARAVIYAGGTFYRQQNTYPAAFTGGALAGAAGDSSKPAPVTLKHYKGILLAKGAQEPLTTDAVRFVSDAACAPTRSATVASAQAYAYVVQYVIQADNGTFVAMCLKL